MDKPLQGEQVLIVIESQYIPGELRIYQERLSSYGAKVDLVSRLWGQLSAKFYSTVEPGVQDNLETIDVNLDFNQINLDDYAAVIVTANYTSVRLRWSERDDLDRYNAAAVAREVPAHAFMRRAMCDPSLVKAMPCHALWLLTPSPELLQNRQVICNKVVLADVLNAGAIYTPCSKDIPAEKHVIVDGDLITNDSWHASEELIDQLKNLVVKMRSVRQRQRMQKNTFASASTTDVGAVLQRLAKDVVSYWLNEFNPYTTTEAQELRITERPIAKLIRPFLGLSTYKSPEAKALALNAVESLTHTSIPSFGNRSILICASESGVWASELTVVAMLALAAGYRIKIATETGKPPHLLSVSCDPNFVDGSLGERVVSFEESELAKRFLNPASEEGQLMLAENILSLDDIVRPPLVRDFLLDAHKMSEEIHDGIFKLRSWVESYDAIIIAGGSGAVAGFTMNGGLHHLILAFHRLARPIVAQCNGVLSLIQTIDPHTAKSILNGRFATTHSKTHEYRRGGWGWAKNENGTEVWTQPGADGNPIIDSEYMLINALGDRGKFRSPPASTYAVAVDEHIITARSTPDGAPAMAALMSKLDSDEPLRGRHFITDPNGFYPFP